MFKHMGNWWRRLSYVPMSGCAVPMRVSSDEARSLLRQRIAALEARLAAEQGVVIAAVTWADQQDKESAEALIVAVREYNQTPR